MRLKSTFFLLFIVCNMWCQSTHFSLTPSPEFFEEFGSATIANTNETAMPNRIQVLDNQNEFFKPAISSKANTLERHRLWLNMTNTEGAFKQLLVGYIEGATNGFDSDFDGVTMNANAFIDFYSVNLGSNLVIQGRALPFTTTDVVPLGYRSIIAGEFTISIAKADGQLTYQAVFLEDKLTNTLNDLRKGSYTFTTASGVFNNRFVLRYKNESLGVGEVEIIKNNIFISNKNNIINIEAAKTINNVLVFDTSGKLLYHKERINNDQFSTQELGSTKQILLVKVLLENGYDETQKIILR
ncbi:MAG: T9SS sorting signal type C domain-containing protein [Flavobacterium sp.]